MNGAKEEPISIRASTVDATKSPWTSLEITKLLVDVIKTLATLSVTVAIFWFGQQYTQTATAESARSQKLAALTKQRVVIWADVAGHLNDIYCYFTFVGQWKELRPRDMIARKRSLEKTMYSYRPFFSDVFFSKYRAFVDAAFKQYRGWGKDAQLRTAPVRPLDASAGRDYFTGEDNSGDIHTAYFELLREAGKELDVDIGATPSQPQKPSPEELKAGPS